MHFYNPPLPAEGPQLLASETLPWTWNSRLGDRAGVCLSCSKLYLWGLTLARNITGAQSALTEGVKKCSLQRSPLGVPYVIKPRTCALTTLVSLPGIIPSGFLVLLWNLHCFLAHILASFISLDTRPSLALISTFLRYWASVSNTGLATGTLVLGPALLMTPTGPLFWVSHPARQHHPPAAAGAVGVRLYQLDWMSGSFRSILSPEQPILHLSLATFPACLASERQVTAAQDG